MDHVILSALGSARRKVAVKDITVPDLWHIAMWLNEQDPDIGHDHLRGQSPGDAVLECWNLCQDLLANIIANGKL